ncbi:MAG: DUF3631 domain-containing protein, partial [bacterium]|nr:DUF3631 domain-containing protein [bacterium]
GDGSIWMFGKGKPVAYGLDRLGAVREAGYLILVEGESDCWTLWHHGFPAIGIPGAGMTKVLRVDNLENIPRILVCQEPGRGGETFVAGVAKQLRNLKWKGDLFVFSLTGCKDPNELHRVDPERFTPTFQSALDGAERLEFTNPASDADVGASIEIDRVVTSSGLDKLTKNSTPRQIDESLREFVARLEGSDDLLRAVARVTAIKQLQRIKSGAPAKLVDAAFKTLRESTDHRDLPGHHGFLSDPEPHQEPVDGTKLLDDLVRTFEKFIVLVDGAAVALALWTIHTYAIAASYISPIIALLSPEKRCGKTTVLIVLGALVRKSLPASNITSAALFRSIEHYTPTLLIDEADSFLAKSDELRGVLNSGHTRANAVVIRTVGDNHEPKVFSTWGPKAIALIGKLPSTLEDRSVVIPMRRQAPGEKAERVRQEHLGTELGELRAQIARWVADHEDDLEGIDPDVPHELHDRAQDNWRPLLGIADAAGGDWPERARRAALDLNRSDREGDSTPGVQLLSDLRDLFEGRGVDRMSSEQIVAVLTKMEDRPWPEWRRGQPLTQSGLARLLKRYDIRPRT